ncbi:MAG: hypothetical protein QOJ40_1872 [Verrucomicrobiota bacterium]
MDDFQNKQPVQPVANDLQVQVDSLRHLVTSVLVLVIVVSGTFNLYLLRQVKYAKMDLSGVRQQANQMIAEYKRVNEPLMQEFLRKITDYGKTHPDFTPILTKYGVRATPIASAPPATATAPAATAPKK